MFQLSIFRVSCPLPILQWQYQGTSPDERFLRLRGHISASIDIGFLDSNGETVFTISWDWSIKKYHQTKYHGQTIYVKITSIPIIKYLSSLNLKSENKCVFSSPSNLDKYLQLCFEPRWTRDTNIMSNISIYIYIYLYTLSIIKPCLITVTGQSVKVKTGFPSYIHL